MMVEENKWTKQILTFSLKFFSSIPPPRGSFCIKPRTLELLWLMLLLSCITIWHNHDKRSSIQACQWEIGGSILKITRTGIGLCTVSAEAFALALTPNGSFWMKAPGLHSVSLLHLGYNTQLQDSSRSKSSAITVISIVIKNTLLLMFSMAISKVHRRVLFFIKTNMEVGVAEGRFALACLHKAISTMSNLAIKTYDEGLFSMAIFAPTPRYALDSRFLQIYFIIKTPYFSSCFKSNSCL